MSGRVSHMGLQWRALPFKEQMLATEFRHWRNERPRGRVGWAGYRNLVFAVLNVSWSLSGGWRRYQWYEDEWLAP